MESGCGPRDPLGTVHHSFGLFHGKLESENQLGWGSASLPGDRQGSPGPGRGSKGSVRPPWGSVLRDIWVQPVVGRAGYQGSWGFLAVTGACRGHRQRPESRPGL